MNPHWPTRRRASAMVAASLLVASLPTSALGAHGHPNPSLEYITLTSAAGAGEVVALIDSGQVFDGKTFEGIPDGLGIVPVGDGTDEIDIYVAHEQSHVPFSGFADLEDSSVLRVRVDLDERQVVQLDEVLPPSAGFLRFCSAFMAGPREGFADYTFFINEETDDWVTVPAGAQYGADPAIAPYRQGGYSVYLDTASESFDVISRMGRINHENTVVIPGAWKQLATLTSDDTFNAPSSQIYLHTANDAGQIFTDKGQLWAFQVTATNAGPVEPFDPQNNANDYLEIGANQTWSGRFIHVPTDIARGVTDLPPQQALEQWSNENNIFQFVRVEDMAYDPDSPRTIYFTDTGTTRLAEDPVTGRLTRLPAPPRGSPPVGVASDGRVFKMVLNAKDPRMVDSFSILVEASAIGMRQPDNLAVGSDSIMVQEDSANTTAIPNAKIWRYDFANWTHVATVDLDPTTTTIDPSESSGIIDASEWLGDGWWALDVQAHVNIPSSVSSDTFSYTDPRTGNVLTYQTRREHGQLLLMKIPGS